MWNKRWRRGVARPRATGYEGEAQSLAVAAGHSREDEVELECDHDAELRRRPPAAGRDGDAECRPIDSSSPPPPALREPRRDDARELPCSHS